MQSIYSSEAIMWMFSSEYNWSWTLVLVQQVGDVHLDE